MNSSSNPTDGGIRSKAQALRNITSTKTDVRCVLCECAYLTNSQENARVADTNTRQRIAEGIAAGIVEQARLGDDGIPPVPEIWAPLSRAEDARGGGHAAHRHRSKRT
jgi:N-acetylmuramoyl-L-alanine amidase